MCKSIGFFDNFPFLKGVRIEWMVIWPKQLWTVYFMAMQANKDFMWLSKKYVFCGFLIPLLQVVMTEVLFSVSLVKLKQVIFICESITFTRQIKEMSICHKNREMLLLFTFWEPHRVVHKQSIYLLQYQLLNQDFYRNENIMYLLVLHQWWQGWILECYSVE